MTVHIDKDTSGATIPSSRSVDRGGNGDFRTIEVEQGQWQVSDDPAVEMGATLGSCVSVCLHAEDLGVGGMNHIYQNVGTGPLGGAAVLAELELIVNEFMHRGIGRSHLRARLVGGAQVLLRGKAYGHAIADVCRNYLEQEGIPLLGESTGGTRGRRLRFHPVTGRILVGFLEGRPVEDAPAPESAGNAPELF